MNTSKLIMVVGLPGTGKSIFSRALAADIGARHLNSDVIRAELGLRGKYSPADKAKVYRALKERTEALLNTGSAVIVDATLYREDLRQPYAELKEDDQLFDYYKCYRANIRLKVTAIKIDNLSSEAHADDLLAQLHRYLEVYHRYADKLKDYEGDTSKVQVTADAA